MGDNKSFEDYICDIHNLDRYMKRPRICWSGKGKSNIDKLCSLNKCPKKFKPILSESKFVKCDAIDDEGNLYEIKKYNIKQLKKYRLYSEPIIKVSPRRSRWGKGHPFYDNFNGSDEYNTFICSLMETDWWGRYSKVIMDSITHSNSGIICKDGFIPHNQLEFKWVVNKGDYSSIFDGYYRLCIVFKVKEEHQEVTDIIKSKKSILTYIKEFFKV